MLHLRGLGASAVDGSASRGKCSRTPSLYQRAPGRRGRGSGGAQTLICASTGAGGRPRLMGRLGEPHLRGLGASVVDGAVWLIGGSVPEPLVFILLFFL